MSVQRIYESSAQVESSEPIGDRLEVDQCYLDRAIKVRSWAANYFQRVVRFFLDRFYLPMNMKPIALFFTDCDQYAGRFVDMLKGNNSLLDPKFPNLRQIIDRFNVRDIPVKVKIERGEYTFQTRVIESKREVEGKKLRLILFSFYNHQDEFGNPWNPLSTDELSGAALDVLRAFQKRIRVDSMHTFSLGSLVIDGFKSITEDQLESVPKVLILNRCLPSIQKVSSRLYPFPISNLLYRIVRILGLDANPEQNLLNYFTRFRQTSSSMEGRKVVMMEAKYDRYFSGTGAFDPSFLSHLEMNGVEVAQGTFYAPLVEPTAHHAYRLDGLIKSESSDLTLLPFHNESLSSSLVRDVLSESGGEDGYHTCFIIGGNKDNLNSITFLQAAPLLTEFVQHHGQTNQE